MSEIKRAILFGKLNPLAYKAVESATIFCKMRGNPYVELLHWLFQVFQLADSDLHRILGHFSVNSSRLATDLTAALDRLPRGATSISDFSPHLEEAVERGWVFGSLLFGENRVRTGHVVVALLKTPSLRNLFLNLSKEFSNIKLEALTDHFAQVTAGSPEESLGAADQAGAGGVAPGETSGAMAPPAMGKQEALGRFSVDLTEKARKGEIDPILGRDEEIRQIVDILMRRRQNNPILTGEAGGGKRAGGEVVARVIGARRAAGQGDAANLLKPALARGTLRTIAATTWAEYKKYFEKDPALTRRFQVIKVEEPSEDKAVLMIRGLAPVLEKHHQVDLLDEALEAAARLSHRYIPSRQLPDKAVSLIDTACARVAISQHATPPTLEDCQRGISALESELAIIEREASIGIDHQQRKTDVEAKLALEKDRLANLEAAYKKEKLVVDEILELRRKLRPGSKSVEANNGGTKPE